MNSSPKTSNKATPILSFLLLLAFSLLLATCKNNQEGDTTESTHTDFEQAELTAKYAKYFAIENLASGHRVTIYNPLTGNTLQQLRLLPQEAYKTYQPSEEEIVLKVPCQRMALLSDTFVGALEQLDARHLLVATSDTKTLFDPQLQERAKKRDLHSVSPTGVANVEQLIALGVDLVMANYYQGVEVTLPLGEEAPIAIVYNNDWQEQSLLARAEWIKVIGLLAGKGATADSLFNVVERNYLTLAEQASREQERPKVFFGNAYQGTWYLPAADSYVAKMIRDAGGIYNAPTTTNSEAGISFELVLQQHRTDDLWLSWQAGSIANRKEFAQIDPRYELFEAYKKGKVYLNDARSTPYGNDYFESAPYRPDLVLRDLITIFYPSSALAAELAHLLAKASIVYGFLA